jgi:2-methylcitrate dehydratase PrpD
LALGESLDLAGSEFGVAIVAGYEVAARIGGVAGRRFHARGLHATGVVGPLAAAVTASRLLRLSGQQTAWAIGLAASMSGGLMAFTQDGGWSKWLHAGWAAHGGIVAAQLASRGFVGPEHVLAGGLDLYSALLNGEAVEHDALTRDLGQTWRGAAAEFKYYPCAHVIHPYIDAVLELVIGMNLKADQIESMVCSIAPWAAAIVAEPRAAKLRFDTELEAIASLPYQLAIAVLERRVDLSALQARQRGRPDVLQMAQRIETRTDPSLGRGFDGRLQLLTRDGRCFEREVSMPGSDRARIRDKFITNAGDRLCASIATTGTGAALESATETARLGADAVLGSGDPDWRPAAALLTVARGDADARG